MTFELALSLVQQQLNIVAQSSDFWTIFNTIFGSSYNQTVASSLQQQWQAGDFRVLPTIQILSSDVLGNANGGYAISNNTIYLANSFVAGATSEALSAVILEEIGHFVDAQINTVDTPGDEGALFSLLVRSQVLTAAQLTAIQAEDDHYTILIDGQIIGIEAAITDSTVNGDRP